MPGRSIDIPEVPTRISSLSNKAFDEVVEDDSGSMTSELYETKRAASDWVFKTQQALGATPICNVLGLFERDGLMCIIIELLWNQPSRIKFWHTTLEHDYTKEAFLLLIGHYKNEIGIRP